MKLENQVCSLKLAKKLKELEVRQESLFVWFSNSTLPENKIPSGVWLLEYKEGLIDRSVPLHRVVSAFTVAELGEKLPKYFISWLIADGWCCSTPLNWVGDFEEHEEYAKSEASARAKMLIYLIENKLIVLKGEK